MPKYKVFTEWTGYSVVTVGADNAQDAEAKVYSGDYDPDDELSTGSGFHMGADGKINLVVSYGSKPLEFAKGKNAYDHEEVIDVSRFYDEDEESKDA